MGDDTVSLIKDKIDIVTLVSSYIPLTKSGRNYKALCPFHGEKTPSFMVSPELGIYKCFGCQKGGDIFEFVKEIENVEFKEALEILAEKTGVKIKRSRGGLEKSKKEILFEISNLSAEYYNYILLKHKVGKEALRYLSERRIGKSACDFFKIGYSPNSWNSLGTYLLKKGYHIQDIARAGLVQPKSGGRGFYDLFRGRIMFPIKDARGRIVGFSARAFKAKEPKYINTKDTPIYKKEAVLYNLDKAKEHIKNEGYALLVEGVVDVITPYMAGVKNIVAPLGTGLTHKQIILLKRFCDTIELFFDTDSAGKRATQRGIDLAQKNGVSVKVATLPKTLKDPDEAVRKDKKTFFKSIKEAVNIYDHYINIAKETFDVTDPISKKKCADFLIPKISDIAHAIEKDHYIRKVSALLGVSENSVLDMINEVGLKKKLGAPRESGKDVEKMTKNLGSERYMIALILKSPLNLAQKNIHKLGTKDFSDETSRELFNILKGYLSGRKRQFNIKYFVSRLGGELKKETEKLYLLNLNEITDDDILLEKELTSVFKTLKKRGIKRELKTISAKIKEAEEEKDGKTLKKLSEEFAYLSKRLKEL